jgi:hypothetical protein
LAVSQIKVPAKDRKENKSMRLELKAPCKEIEKMGGEANCQVDVKKEV